MEDMNHPVVVVAIIGIFFMVLKTVFEFVKEVRSNGNGSSSSRYDTSEFRGYHMEAAKTQTRTVAILEELALVGRERSNRLEDMHKENQTKLDSISRKLEVGGRSEHRI